MTNGNWGNVLTDENGRIIGLERATLKELSNSDANVLSSDLDSTVSAKKESFVAELIQKNKGYVKSLIESVNDNSKQGYGGLSSDGNELTAQWLTPNDFPEVTGDWQRSVASGVQDFLSGTTGEQEGLIIFGWANKVASPPVAELKLYKGTEESVAEPLPWIVNRISSTGGDCTDNGGSVETPIVEMRKPLIVPPETNWKVEEKKVVSGCDALQPLGFYVRTAENAWDLAL